MDDYLAGVVESNDQEEDEKKKTMAILAKQYMVYYLHPNTQHPNIEDASSYNAIDDPRSFQKYVGAGLDDTLEKRLPAVQETQNLFISYNTILPILPYFNCSPGYTLSAKQQRWRTDTPYLQNVIDFYSCNEFNGHGVWLSGKMSKPNGKIIYMIRSNTAALLSMKQKSLK